MVIQANRWLQGHPSVTLCPLTSTLVDAPLVRLPVPANPRNGLRKPSQLMVDKLFTVPVDSIGTAVGVLDVVELDALDLALRAWLDLP